MVINLRKNVFKQYQSNKDLSAFYLHDDGKKNGGHRYETKLRHCHTMYAQGDSDVILSYIYAS